MEEEGAKLYGEQEIMKAVEDIKEEDQVYQIRKEIKWVQGEIQMQWILTKEEKEIGYAMYIENGAIWPKVVGRDRKKRDG